LLLLFKHTQMRQKILLLLCMATLGLASCKKDTIIQDSPNRTIITTIPVTAWKPYDNGRGYTAEVSIPEIDQLNVDIEGILVYLDHPAETSSYIAVPYVYAGNSYSFEHYNGGVAIDIQTATFGTALAIKPTVPIRIKVVLIPSRNVS
jgi:hypothetical protein